MWFYARFISVKAFNHHVDHTKGIYKIVGGYLNLLEEGRVRFNSRDRLTWKL